MSRPALIVTMLLGLAVACGDERARVTTTAAIVERAGPVAVRAGETRPPGSPLGTGFTVAEGSLLLGRVLPAPPVPLAGRVVQDRGWQAYLVVTGNPLVVADRYVEQAVGAGLLARGTQARCSGGRNLEEHAALITCTAQTTTDAPTDVAAMLADERTFRFELVWGDRASSYFHSFAHIAYAERGHGRLAPLELPPLWRRTLEAEAAASAPVPAAPRSLPGIGAHFGHPHSALTVEEGSALVSRTMRIGGTDSTTMLHLTGPPLTVARAYERRLRDSGLAGSLRIYGTDGSRIAYGVYVAPVDQGATLFATLDGDQGSYLVVSDGG